MSWQIDSGEFTHELTVRCRFSDGAVSTGGSTGVDADTKVLVEPVPESPECDQGSEWRSSAEVVAWDVHCICRQFGSSTASGQTSWTVRNQWTRVPSRSLEDVAAGRLYAADDETLDVSGREDVSSVALELWQREHLAPADADAAIVQALKAHWATSVAIDAAVAHSRLVGRTWEQVGAAGNMSRAAAHSRWADRVADLPRLASDIEQAKTILAETSEALDGLEAHARTIAENR